MKKFWNKLVWLYWRWRRGKTPHFGYCAYCGHFGWLHYTPPMTQYPDRDDGIGPNHVGHLCHPCRDAYVEYWKEMWDDYYSGLL